jgi:hypothetical protein
MQSSLDARPRFVLPQPKGLPFLSAVAPTGLAVILAAVGVGVGVRRLVLRLPMERVGKSHSLSICEKAPGLCDRGLSERS